VEQFLSCRNTAAIIDGDGEAGRCPVQFSPLMIGVIWQYPIMSIVEAIDFVMTRKGAKGAMV